MKIEFLVALTDHTWYTQTVDVPRAALPQHSGYGDTKQGDIDRREPYLTEAVDAWMMENISLFDGEIALVAVYNRDPDED